VLTQSLPSHYDRQSNANRLGEDVGLRHRPTPPTLKEHNVVFEMAHIEILAGKQLEFEAAVQQALPLFARAKGCHGAELHRIVERNTSYVLLVRWNTVEDHMVDFRQSDDFQAWRALVGPFFAKAPEVVHSEVAVK